MVDEQRDEHGRIEPPPAGDEVGTLCGFLDFLRGTLELKCRGLGDEQLRATLAPSDMTLGGMLKHLAYVEDYWFVEVVQGLPEPEPWASVDWRADADWDWHSAGEDSGDQLRALWAASVERSRSIVADRLARGADALDVRCSGGGRPPVTVRWVLVHMIEEYARHCGHADLIRESIDGQTGE